PDQTRAARASGHPRERPRAAALSLFLPCCCSSTFLPLLTLLLLFYFFFPHPRCPAPSLNLLLLSRFATPHVSTAASLLLSLAPPYCCYYSFPLLLSHLSPSPLLLHLRPPPRPGRRGGAPSSHHSITVPPTPSITNANTHHQHPPLTTISSHRRILHARPDKGGTGVWSSA
uniref:Uncharacterized protein n=1 Tax=Aegilops tauschii subsp. strangulata TaxID=200361 RepID=A0A452YKQ2_AEGTS